jgi:hypothetical protein
MSREYYSTARPLWDLLLLFLVVGEESDMAGWSDTRVSEHPLSSSA